MTPYFNREDLRAAVDVPNDVLENWLKHGIIRSTQRAPGIGNRRRFTSNDVMVAGIAKAVKRLGCRKHGIIQVTEAAYRLMDQGQDLSKCSPDAVLDLGLSRDESEMLVILRDISEPSLAHQGLTLSCMSINVGLIAQNIFGAGQTARAA